MSEYEALATKGKKTTLKEPDFINLANHFEHENLLEDALEVLDTAISHFKDSAALHIRKARLLIYKKDIDKALESLNRAEIYGEDSFEVDILRVRALCYQKKFDEANALLTNLKIKYFPYSDKLSDVYCIEALLFERQEHYEQMYQALKDALLENPNNREALHRMFLCVEVSRKHRESVHLHLHLIDEQPYSHLAWYNLAHAYYAISQYEDAVEAFDYAYLIDENFDVAYLDCAELCYSIHKWEKALDCYLQAVTLIEPDEEVLCRIGECYHNLGNTEKAKIYLYRALAHNPKDEEVYFHIGQAYAKEGKWESAIHFYKQAVKLSPDRDDFLAALAKTNVHLQHPNEALVLYKRAVQVLPDFTEYWVGMARIYIEKNQIEVALAVMEEADKHTIGYDIYYCTAACQFMLGAKKQAMDSLKEGLLENYDAHTMLFEICPRLTQDKDVQAILRYYKSEQVAAQT